MVLLTRLFRNLIKKDAVQATLDALKACVIGVILATGSYMLLINCIGSVSDVSADYTAIVLAAALGAVYFGSRKFIKRGISPIILICIAGAAGVLVYGR